MDRLREFSSRVAGGDASVAFAAFVLVHAGCGKEVMESRLTEDTVAMPAVRRDGNLWSRGLRRFQEGRSPITPAL